MPEGSVRRSRLPAFVIDLFQPRSALLALVAGSLALLAAGLDPRVFSSGTPDAQSALRERPQIESLFLLSALAEAAFLLVGGVLGDIIGRRRVLLGGLIALVLFETGSMLSVDGPLFFISRIGAVASVGVVLPVSLAIIAVSYSGVARATALGIAYAALGVGTAVAPAVLSFATPVVGRWPSFLLVIAAAAIALVVVARVVSNVQLPGLRLRTVYPHALWAFGLLAVTGGVIGFRSNSESSIRIGLIVGGVLLVATFLLLQRRRGAEPEETAIDLRPTAVALVAGVVIAIAQIAPILELPLFFQIAQRFAPLLATIATAPFIIALVVAGPVAGLLMTRFSARTLISGGLVVVGMGDLLLSLSAPETPYLFFILPFFAVGAGFVVGTGIRTAVIFASTPRRLPATAAALNQSSLVVGAQAGVAGVTALVASAAVNAYSAALPAGADPTAVDSFRSFLAAVGTSEFGDVVGNLSSTTTVAYGAAFAAGVQTAMLLVGLAAIVAAAICWLLMPTTDERVNNVFDLREEGQPAT